MTLKTASPELIARILNLMDEANFLLITDRDAEVIGHNLLNNGSEHISDSDISQEIDAYYNN